MLPTRTGCADRVGLDRRRQLRPRSGLSPAPAQSQHDYLHDRHDRAADVVPPCDRDESGVAVHAVLWFARSRRRSNECGRGIRPSRRTVSRAIASPWSLPRSWGRRAPHDLGASGDDLERAHHAVHLVLEDVAVPDVLRVVDADACGRIGAPCVSARTAPDRVTWPRCSPAAWSRHCPAATSTRRRAGAGARRRRTIVYCAFASFFRSHCVGPSSRPARSRRAGRRARRALAAAPSE